MSPRRLLVRSSLLLLAIVAAIALHVGTSMTGRGGRAVEGQRHTVETPSGRSIVYYERRPASGPAAPVPVLLLASFARSVADFNELTASLAAAGYRTIAVESRGIGGSGGGGPGQSLTLHDLADDLETVIDGLGPDVVPTGRVHLVGHAFGNRVVRTFAKDRPERVESVTLIAAGGLVPIAPAIRRALERSVASFLPWSIREEALRLAFFSKGSPIPDDWVGGWWLWGGFVQQVATASTSSDEFWDAGSARMLVLQAEDDTIAPPEDSGLRLLAAYPERVELVMVPDAGHALLPEQAARIRGALLDFLARSGRPAGA